MKYLCLLFLLFPAYCAAQSDSARFVAIDRTLEALVERDSTFARTVDVTAGRLLGSSCATLRVRAAST